MRATQPAIEIVYEGDMRLKLDIGVLNAGPIAPAPRAELPLCTVDKIVAAEMERLAPLFKLRTITPIDVAQAMYMACNIAQGVSRE